MRQLNVLMALFVLTTGIVTAWAPAADAAPDQQAPALYVAATGHHLAGSFAAWWWDEQNRIWAGNPVTESLEEEGRIVQYFEYARLELVPETADAPASVELGRVGAEYFSRTEPGPAQEDRSDDDGSRLFAATGWGVANGFAHLWAETGGLERLGYPLSAEHVDTHRTVQYFERGRLEYWPGLGASAPRLVRTPIGFYVALARDLALEEVSPDPAAVVIPPGSLDEATVQAVQSRLAADRQASWRAATTWPTAPTPWRAGPGGVRVRAWPALEAPVVEWVPTGHFLTVEGVAWGAPVAGETAWAAVPGIGFAPPGTLRPYRPTLPARHPGGRWLDADLDAMVLTAYEGETPLFAIWINAGRPDWPTPRGLFRITRRVRTETLDSATFGIPPGHPDYYLIPNVPYTLYFDGQGNAIHTTTSADPTAFGRYASFGCLTMREQDAARVWEFAPVGTPLLIRGGRV